MRNSCEYDVAVSYIWGTNEGDYSNLTDLGIPDGYGWWAPAWTDWFTSGGEKGTEPPAEIKEMLDLRAAFLAATSDEEAKSIMKQITDWQAETMYVLGLVESVGSTVVYNSDLKNIPDIPNVWERGDIGRIGLWYFSE